MNNRLVFSLGATLLPGVALAESAQANGADTAWILTSSALVLFMTLPGLALFYAGLVRSKNVLSVLMQCFSIAAVISLVWVGLGYSLAFSGDGALVGNLEKAFLAGIDLDALSGTMPETLFVMFQMTFAIITPALIIGAFAERIRFSAMLAFSILWSLIVYSPVAHWVWGGGWLAAMGSMDFAGGIVVHVTAGTAALVAAIVIGPRVGFPTTPMLPHNLTMTVTGASMLWVGWFGFNAGSALAANGNAAMAMLVTHLGAASGSFAWMAMEWKKFGKPSVLGIVTGMVAGLGTITPASGFVGPMGAIAIGLTAGFSCFWATQYIKRVLKIDDSLDVFSVHGVGGIIGTLLTALFAATAFGGLGLGRSILDQFWAQLVGVVSTLLWTAIGTWAILKLVDMLFGLRVSRDEEIEGLDVVLHDETGYHDL
jgi:Amt family ammonium transporter